MSEIVYEEGYDQGYREGRRKALQEAAAKMKGKAEIEAEYSPLISACFDVAERAILDLMEKDDE